MGVRMTWPQNIIDGICSFCIFKQFNINFLNIFMELKFNEKCSIKSCKIRIDECKIHHFTMFSYYVMLLFYYVNLNTIKDWEIERTSLLLHCIDSFVPKSLAAQLSAFVFFFLPSI